MPNFISRIFRAKGFGIHSPFAFEFVTKVLSADTKYYAFSEIRDVLLKHSLQDSNSDTHHLLFRIIHFLKPKNILEIASEKGISTLHLTAPSKEIDCVCVETNPDNRTAAHLLFEEWNRKIEIHSHLPQNNIEFDTILVHLHSFSENRNALVDWMMAHSHNKTCWIFTGINRNRCFWKRIMKDERVKICFDKRQLGIAFLDSSYHKLNYFI